MNTKDFSIDLAQESGEIMKKYFSLGMNKEWKKDNSPVTVADKEINSLVIKRIKNAFSEHGISGEEESSFNGDEKFVWVCDPVDGTIPYSHGVPTAVFSLALVDRSDGQPILGVVYDPFMDRMFLAEKGKGATMNNEKISVQSDNQEGMKIIGLESFPMLPYNFSENIITSLRSKFIAVSYASTIYEAMLVASGEFVAAIFAGNTAHDSATTKIIVEEAGGKVTDIFGNEQRYDELTKGMIASNKFVHESILNSIKIN